MNNKFLSDYLIQNFGDSAKPFDSQEYLQTAKQSILYIQSQIDNLNSQFSGNQKEIDDIDKQILEKENQIFKLKDFIDQKAGIESLKTQIEKLSENLDKLEAEKNQIVENKEIIVNKNLEINKKIESFKIQISDLELSLEPMFELGLQNYINQKREQINRILSQNELRKQNKENEFSKKFESDSKDQYPLDDFKDMPEILDALRSTFEAEKQNYIDHNMINYKLEYSQKIIDIFEKSIQNHEKYQNFLDETMDLEVDHKYLDHIHISTLNRNKTFFPYFKEIKELVCHPLFKKTGKLTLNDLKSFGSTVNKKQDRNKFKKFYQTINTIMLDYNIPIVTISDEIINQKPEEERDSIIHNPERSDFYDKYIIIDKEAILQLHRIVNLFNDTRPISFKGFEENIVLIDNLLKSLENISNKNKGSLYGSLNELTESHLDDLNIIVDKLLNLVEKNNIGRNIGQQINMFQNIIWTIYTYFQEFYGLDNLQVKNNLTNLMSHIIEKMYMETFGETIIEDNIHKNSLFSLYNDIGLLIKNALNNDPLIKEMKEKIKFNKQLSPDNIKKSRISCLFDLEKKLTHFIISKNIYDISQNIFLENDVEKGDRETGAELYISSPDFKIPPIDPILLSADKFGIGTSEYMFESYDISDSSNYLAYIRLFNVSDFKKYESIKKSLCKNGDKNPEKDKINNLLKILLDKDKDVFCTSLTFQEFTPLFVHKNFEISIDGINSDGLKFIIGDKNYEMLRTYLFYNFMEANREHDSIITTPKDLIGPSKPKALSDPDSIRIITINPDMTRTIAIPRGTGGTKNFEYKRETIVIQNPKCTTGPSGFHEAKNHGKKLYAHVHNINDFPTRKNSIEKIRLDTCDTYEEFLEKLEEFRKKYSDSSDLVVRVETYRSEFEKYEGAKEKVAYRIAQTKNAPSNILGEKKKRGRPRKNPE